MKTECFLFGTQQRIASATVSDGSVSLLLGEKPINQAQHYKYLGVLIDADLNFKQHVDKLLVKISNRIGVLGRIRNNLTVDAATKVYLSFVLTVTDYCDVAWSSIGKMERDKLDRAQKRAVLLSFIPVHARITRAYSHMLQDKKPSIFLFITWRPTRGRGLHSFESLSFVIIPLSRFTSYHGRRKGKVGSPARAKRGGHRTVVTKKRKRSENYSRTHRFRRYHVQPFESC